MQLIHKTPQELLRVMLVVASKHWVHLYTKLKSILLVLKLIFDGAVLY
jgi:hypothetical protein